MLCCVVLCCVALHRCATGASIMEEYKTDVIYNIKAQRERNGRLRAEDIDVTGARKWRRGCSGRKAAMRRQRLGGGLILIPPRGRQRGEPDVTFMKCYNLCKALIALLHAHTYTHAYTYTHTHKQTHKTCHSRARALAMQHMHSNATRTFFSLLFFFLFFSFINRQSEPRRCLTRISQQYMCRFAFSYQLRDVLCGLPSRLSSKFRQRIPK